MFAEILFPTDGSEGASAAFDRVLDFAVAHGATVHVLNVADTSRSAVGEREDVVATLEEQGERVVDDARARAQDRGVPAVTAVRRGDPYEEIVAYANEEAVDVVVMPTHGRRGLERFLLGSTTERVVRHADVPVLTMRPDAEFAYPFEDVLLPTDGSDSAAAALARATDLASAEDATLHVLSVVDVTSLGLDVRSESVEATLTESARELVDRTVADAEDAGVASVTGAVETGSSIHRTVLSYVDDHDVDLVVVGTHGRTGFDRYVLGSVAEYLVRTSPVPVLTVRAGE